MRVAHPLIQVVLAVVELLRLRLPRELHVDLRVELAALRQLQLKHVRTQTVGKRSLMSSYLPTQLGITKSELLR